MPISMRRTAKPLKTRDIKATSIDLGGELLPLHVKSSKAARRIILKFDPFSRGVVLTVPRRASMKEAIAFAETKKAWLLAQMNDAPDKIMFQAGVEIPVYGQTMTINHMQGRGATRGIGNELQVHGEKTFIARRVKDWLKEEAKLRLGTLAREKAIALGVKLRRISVRDTRSRWGSCSSDGKLSFSWRLIFAPQEVLDYVVSHETAHLLEMNHSVRFWKLVEALCPDWQAQSDWLRIHGHTLYMYG